MLLKSLELQGFKTFPDKTTLTFHNGITAVVGPNGSGKSNISDAIRWALGEQSTRTLRCTKMEDVIFNGTPMRKPLGFAQVTLNIDNTDRQLPVESDNVAITRRYYRSGDSEYMLNKANVRLKDINELFMDTGLGRDGYSIIGQGKIDSIVSARSEDRREIFEEAAGISRFRYRKSESEHKLEQTEENLLRLRDIVSELENRVGPLKEQSEKAKKYLTLAEEKRKLEISLWLDTLDRSGQILHEQEDKIIISKGQYETVEQSINELDWQIEEIFSRSNASSAQIDETRRKSASLEENATKKDGEASVLENDIRHNSENIDRINKEIEQNSLSGTDMENEIAEKKKQISEKQEYIHKQDADFTDCSVKLENLKSGMNESAGKIDDFTRQIAQLTSQATEAKVGEMTAASSISEIELRLSNIRAGISGKAEQSELLKKNEQEYDKKLKEAQERAVKFKNEVKGYELRLETRLHHQEAAKQANDKLRLDIDEQLRRARLLEDLERNMEGFSQSVKTVMKESERGVIGGIHGPVSRIIKVPRQYASAIETALGGAMQNIVVGNENDAKRAINLLKQRNSGRATFLPLSTIRGRVLQENGLSGCAGFIGVASELCSCEGQYKGILNSLLGRIAVAENLDFAVNIAKKYGYKFRIVTLDGQVVNTGGSLTGGSFAKNSGLLSRLSEIDKIKKQAAELQEKAKQTAAALKTAAEESAEAQASLSAAKGELATAQEESIRLDAEHRRILSDYETVQKSSGELSREMETAAARLETQKKTCEAARAMGETIGKKADSFKEKLKNISGSRDRLTGRYNELTADMKQIEMNRLSAQKDIQSLIAAAEDIEKRKLGQSEKISALKAEIKSVRESTCRLTEKIGQLKKEAQEMRGLAGNAEKQVGQLNQKRMELEKQSVEMRTAEREKTDEKEKISHELARLEEQKANLQKEYDDIIAKLWEEYELTRREAEEQTGGKIKDAAKARRCLGEIKGEIKALGNVNVSAVEEYKEVSQRYEFMKAQVDDVEKSRDELSKLITSLTRQMKELFSAKFEQINKNFAVTFRDLFGGGTADLTLSNPNDVLNSGIEISVQPPGKIVAHLESLSGGEKALVAIALYFAIMKVNPPPFCVLDEIEAALDDVNVNRFAAYLRGMNRDTQFIVITHRRGSMEEADVLYGVTMQDKGISKLLEMPVAEIEARMGIKRE